MNFVQSVILEDVGSKSLTLRKACRSFTPFNTGNKRIFVKMVSKRENKLVNGYRLADDLQITSRGVNK